jgi:hypothetical protein
MGFDCAPSHEQLRSDLKVSLTRCGQRGDASLGGGQRDVGFRARAAHADPGDFLACTRRP